MSLKLLFVYNANTGLLNNFIGMGHKILKPETYQCSLCALTHGILGERKAWTRFRESVPIPFEFLHKDEFSKAYASKWLPPYEFPLIFLLEEDRMDVIISREDFETLVSVEDLIAKITAILEKR